MRITIESHRDHGLPEAVMAYVASRVAGVEAPFYMETFELPEHLGEVPCGLHLDVPEAEVHYARRGSRPYESRLCGRAPRMVREVTVIGGGAPCVLWTAFGGPAAPREPGDPSLPPGEAAASAAFWSRAALSA